MDRRTDIQKSFDSKYRAMDMDVAWEKYVFNSRNCFYVAI